MNILDLAESNRRKALEVIKDSGVVPLWESAGAEVKLVGSLKTGLLMKHRDIDFHLYTNELSVADDFKVMERLAENPAVTEIRYLNLIRTEEECIEWHAWYRDTDGELWQIDMIHLRRGSRYDGYFEKFAERISAVLTDETRHAILTLKYRTPDTEKVMGVEYYRAVIRDGVRSFDEFAEWRKRNPVTGIDEWMP